MKNDELIVSVSLEELCDTIEYFYETDSDVFEGLHSHMTFMDLTFKSLFRLFEYFHDDYEGDGDLFFDFVKRGVKEHGSISMFKFKLLDEKNYLFAISESQKAKDARHYPSDGG
jgi:hypothetical protein